MKMGLPNGLARSLANIHTYIKSIRLELIDQSLLLGIQQIPARLDLNWR
jgi:hypothetical protein